MKQKTDCKTMKRNLEKKESYFFVGSRYEVASIRMLPHWETDFLLRLLMADEWGSGLCVELLCVELLCVELLCVELLCGELLCVELLWIELLCIEKSLCWL